MDDDREGRAAPAVRQLASRTPGDDPDDPYADVDVAALPGWWARAIDEFRAHDLRPYRPPRFADDVLTHEVVDQLERELGVEVSFGCTDADCRERWEVRVDGEAVGTVERRRSPRGFTVYGIEGDGFRDLVREAAGDETG